MKIVGLKTVYEGRVVLNSRVEGRKGYTVNRKVDETFRVEVGRLIFELGREGLR